MTRRIKKYRLFFFLCIFIVIAGSGDAQKLRLNAYGSYVFDGTYHIYYLNENFYEGLTSPGPQLGLGLEYLLTPNYGLELSYFRRKTTVRPAGVVNSNRANEALQLQYLLLGINTIPRMGAGRLQAFAGMSAGILVQTPSDRNEVANPLMNQAITKFAWAARLGGMFNLSDRVGIKLQGQWLSALQFQNAAVNFNVRRLNGVPPESSIANQFELGSGIVVKLGDIR